MYTFRILTFSLGLALSGLGMAQTSAPTEIRGARFDGTGLGADTNASFAAGLTRDNGATFDTSARRTENVRIRGIVRPAAEHVGQTGDIFLVDRVDGTFTMRNKDGIYVNWPTGAIRDLVPFLDNVSLTATIDVDFYNGVLGTSGEHKLFLGYMPADGILRYTPVPHKINITEQTAREQALELFSSKVSPNVVQGRCVICHVSGGSAAGTQHTFVRTTDSNHLNINFSQLESLLSARGRSYILTKVSGGLGHGGGTVLTSSQQEYKDLDTMLQLLEP